MIKLLSHCRICVLWFFSQSLSSSPSSFTTSILCLTYLLSSCYMSIWIPSSHSVRSFAILRPSRFCLTWVSTCTIWTLRGLWWCTSAFHWQFMTGITSCTIKTSVHGSITSCTALVIASQCLVASLQRIIAHSFFNMRKSSIKQISGRLWDAPMDRCSLK